MIFYAERVTRDWLMDGFGSPFHITKCLTSAEFAEELKLYLNDEDWRIYIATNGQNLVVVLTMPCEKEYKNKMIEYTDVKVLAGPIGPEINHRLQKLKNRWDLTLSHQQINSLANGLMGNYELLGDNKKKGLLSTAIMADSKEAYNVREATDGYSYEIDIADRFNRLNAHDQESISMIIDALLAKQKP